MATRCKTVSFQPQNKENLDNININFTLNINKASFKASSLDRKNVILGKKIDNSQISLNNPTIMQYPILIEEPKKTIKMANFIKKQENVKKSENKVEKTKVLNKKTEKIENFDEIIDKIKQINPVLKKIFEMKGGEVEKGLEKLKFKGKKTKKSKKPQKPQKKPIKIENDENPMKTEKINQNITKNEKITNEKLNKEEKIKKVDKLILENLKRIKLEKQTIEQQEYEEKNNRIRKMAIIREKNQKIREFNKATFLNKLSSGKTIRFISKTRGFSNEKQAKTSRNLTKKRLMTEEQLASLREFMKNRRKMKKHERKIAKEPKKLKKEDRNPKIIKKEERKISEERIDREKVFRTAAIFIQKFWRGFLGRKYYKEVILGQNDFYSKNDDAINYPLKNNGEIENNDEIESTNQKTKRIEGNYGRFVDSDEKNNNDYYLEKPRSYYKNYGNKEEFAPETTNFNSKTSFKNIEYKTQILLEKRQKNSIGSDKNEAKSPKEVSETAEIDKEKLEKFDSDQAKPSEESNKRQANPNPPEFFSKDFEIDDNINNNNIICNNNNRETLVDLSASSNSCELKNREFQTNYYYENSRKSSRNLSINLDDEDKNASELFNKEKLSIGKIHDFDNNLQPPLIKSGQKLEFSRNRWEKIKPRKLLGVLDKNLLKEAIDIREKARKIKPELAYFDKKELVRGFNRIIETLNKAKIDSHFIGNGSSFSRTCFSEGDGFVSPSLILNTGSSLFSDNNEKNNGNQGNSIKTNEIYITETSKIEKNAIIEQNFVTKLGKVDKLGKDDFEEKKEEKLEINKENPENNLSVHKKLEAPPKGDKTSKNIEDIEKSENSLEKGEIASVIEISKFHDTEKSNFPRNHDLNEISNSGEKSGVVTHRNHENCSNKFESQFSEPKIPIHNADSPERPSFFEETPLRLLEATSLIEPLSLTVKFTDDNKGGYNEGVEGLDNDSVKGKNKETDGSLVGVRDDEANELKQEFCFGIQGKVDSFDDVVSPVTTAQKKYEITDSQLSSVGNTPYENQGSNFESQKKEERKEEKYIYDEVEIKSEEKGLVFAADAENEWKNDKIVSPKENLKKPVVSSPLVATQTIPFNFTEKIDHKKQSTNDDSLEKNDKVTEALLDLLVEEVLRSNLVIKAFSSHHNNSEKHLHHESLVKSPPKEYALESTSPPKKNKIIEIPSNAANFSLNRQKFNDLFLEYLIQFKSIILYEDQGLRNTILENLGKALGTSEKEKLKTSRENSFKFTSMLNDNMILPYIDRRVIKNPVIPEEFYPKIQNSIAVEYCKIDQNYFKSVFDACNDLLNSHRPFGDRSRPYPWEKGNKNKQKIVMDDDLNEIFGKCLNKIETFPSFLCGIFLEKEGFPARSKMGSFEDFVARTREDKMKKMLVKEYEENEEDWQDFREDELELKLEISELVFQELVKEMAMDLKGKLNK